MILAIMDFSLMPHPKRYSGQISNQEKDFDDIISFFIVLRREQKAAQHLLKQTYLLGGSKYDY